MHPGCPSVVRFIPKALTALGQAQRGPGACVNWVMPAHRTATGLGEGTWNTSDTPAHSPLPLRRGSYFSFPCRCPTEGVRRHRGQSLANSAKAAGRGRCWRAVPPENPGDSWAGAVSIETPALCYLQRHRGPLFPWPGKWAEPRIHPDTTGPRESAPWRPLGCPGPTVLKQTHCLK